LTLPVAPREYPESVDPEPLSRNQNRFPHPLAKESGFPGSERLPSTSAPKSERCFRSARSVWREPATGPPALPPRPGFRRLFALLECSRTEELDPSWIRGFITRGRKGPRAACRLLQPNRSASTTDESPEPRAPPKWSPTCAALIADGYAEPGRRFLSVAVAGARPVESSRVRDQGPGAHGSRIASAPPTTIARSGSFAPTRSTRTPRVANS
jgi:hypothetical protein